MINSSCSSTTPINILAIDPGREKCGIAVLTFNGTKIITRAVISTNNLLEHIKILLSEYPITIIIMGNGTTLHNLKDSLKILAEEHKLSFELVEEKHTTELARKRYFKENPPMGLKKLIPLGMQIPPVPVDDWVAVILAERYITGKNRI